MNRIDELIEHYVCKEPDQIRAMIDTILDEVYDTIISQDPSVKLILHEPYRSIAKAVNDYFYEEVEE